MQYLPQRASLLIATAALFSLIATACGAIVTATEQQALQTQDASPALTDSVPAAPAPAAEPAPSGHQYGSTIDEWTATEQQRRAASPSNDAAQEASSEYREIAWDILIPEGASGDELMARFEERLDAAEPGTDEARELYEEIQAAYDPEAVNVDLDGEKIRLAGFIAPLTYDDDIITEFLLVPTFGACIHVPPPPPNQTIMVSLDKANGLTLEDSWGAVWVEGTMLIESGDSDLGATSYRIADASSGVYNDF